LNWKARLGWVLVGVAGTLGSLLVLGLTVYFSVDRATRPAGPPAGVTVSDPWGTINIENLDADCSELATRLVESIKAEAPGKFDPDCDGLREYDVLALSGGGANGAFGAGFLAGWTQAGTRPDFKVVTGVSTGALQATHAFLGSDYDNVLREIYTGISTEDVHVPRGLLEGLFSDALRDTEPLQRLIEKHVTNEVLAAVAAKHAEGYRLFVGTTNMDAHEFVIWDMGAIASSGRPDALAQYRKVLLASSSVPIVFPPVYFQVEGSDGKQYAQMHTDGGTYAQVFFRGFLLEFEEAIRNAAIDWSGLEISLYIIRNGQADEDLYAPIGPSTLEIANATISQLFHITMRAALFRMYFLTSRFGVRFNLAEIPADYPYDLDPMNFETERMQQLYQTGFKLAAAGFTWRTAPPRLDPAEVSIPPASPPEAAPDRR
jgi:hypothetical protein